MGNLPIVCQKLANIIKYAIDAQALKASFSCLGRYNLVSEFFMESGNLLMKWTLPCEGKVLI